jgi:hypothetical protein
LATASTVCILTLVAQAGPVQPATTTATPATAPVVVKPIWLTDFSLAVKVSYDDRERRNQIQDRAKIVFQYDIGKVLVRPTVSLLY